MLSGPLRAARNDMEGSINRKDSETSTDPCLDVQVFEVGSCLFVLPLHYSPVHILGFGASGAVISASDSRSEGLFAIKCIPDPSGNPRLAQRVSREVALLRYLKHPNILGLKDAFMCSFNHVYVVAEKMDADLHAVMSSTLQLTPDHHLYLMYQLVRAVHYMHSANIVHRDLKPQNILLSADCELKIADFGLARESTEARRHPMRGGGEAEGEAEVEAMTEYVVTRQYRAPEIMLACKRYGTAVDMWAVGCIFAELLLSDDKHRHDGSSDILFPGRDYLHMLRLITAFLGKPLPTELRAFGCSPKACAYMASLPESPGVDLRRRFPAAPLQALHLLARLLTLDPGQRISAGEALQHPYFARVFDEQDLTPAVPSEPFRACPLPSPPPQTGVRARMSAPSTGK